eukprot:12217914-Alexandrium_andersonii.AAC.1
MTACFCAGAPEEFGNSGTAAGFSWAHCSQMLRTTRACRTTAHAGHSPGGRYRGAPGKDPQAHR